MKLIAAVVAASLLAASGHAAACRDTKGKFVKCPTPAASSTITKGKDGKCRDAKGHFAKCPR